jgi:hypothetical protein
LLVVPTSTSWQRDSARISGTRKAPPISTSSPRETTTSRSPANAASASTAAAALLFTTTAASAPVSSRSKSATCAWRVPRSPVVRSSSRLQ